MKDIDKIQREVRRQFSLYADRPVIVHSDLFRSTRFIEPAMERSVLLNRHVDLLNSLGVRLFVPAFNYQFPKKHYIDLRSAPVELGPLNEYMLREWAHWRTTDPVFSFAVKKPYQEESSDVSSLSAFGEESVFASVVKNKGAIFMYGASISAMTMIHYIESVAGGPVYRYDKQFSGTVVSWDGKKREISYLYHVRPLNMKLDYDWHKIQNTLARQDILTPLLDGNFIFGFVANAENTVECLVKHLQEDPLFLLNQESRAWIEPLCEKLGRRFVVSDFES